MRDVTYDALLCGQADCVRRVKAERDKLMFTIDNSKVKLRIVDSGQVDMVIGVFSVTDPKSLETLKTEFRQAKSEKPSAAPMIVGLGLENRGSLGKTQTKASEGKQMANSYGATYTEVIASDMTALAAGIISQHIRKDPEQFRKKSGQTPGESNDRRGSVSTTDGDSKDKKKKKKKKEEKKENESSKDKNGSGTETKKEKKEREKREKKEEKERIKREKAEEKERKKMEELAKKEAKRNK